MNMKSNWLRMKVQFMEIMNKTELMELEYANQTISVNSFYEPTSKTEEECKDQPLTQDFRKMTKLVDSEKLQALKESLQLEKFYMRNNSFNNSKNKEKNVNINLSNKRGLALTSENREQFNSLISIASCIRNKTLKNVDERI